uniref:Uncharacterized protein n=1 Tax=Setaria viridis TaxID=4556 RepID=A0A4V6D634_SETVI|nr:hypothetical protein SEVIR_8G063552v2 [Setaria viridis]
MEEKFEWDSDNDNVLEPGSRSKDSYIVFLGFHPYKEVVFLSDKFNRVLAYNWSISKLQDLGKLYPKFYIERDHQFFHRLNLHLVPLAGSLRSSNIIWPLRWWRSWL